VNKMNDDLPNSYEDLLSKLQREGTISVEFEEKNKQRLKASFDRVNKTESLLANRKGLFGSIAYFIYSIWVGVVDVIFSPKDIGFDRALLVYTVLWGKISNYEGESLEAGIARVTFYART